MIRLTLFLTLLLGIPAALADPIDRVEPPFWWAGMHNSNLQLMIHGDRIAQWSVSLEHPRVSLTEVHRVESENYLFVDLDVRNTFRGGIVTLQFVHENGDAFQHDYAFHTRRKDSADRNGFNTTDAIYLITPDRFANGDPSNDSLAELKEAANRDSSVGRHGGDLDGMIQHLDYIADMGFTAIWPTPMLENDQAEYSYHGYSITDFYRVDPRFGDNEDYRQLSLQGKAKGVGLIQDMILNHIGSGHWWMDDLPTDDWLNFQGEFVPTTHYRTSVQDPYAADIDKQEFADGWFVKSMPDLNQRNPLVANYLIQNSIWWIEYADLYGIRTDTYSYSDKDFLTEWTRRIMAEYPNFNIVGEEWSTNPNVVSYWQRGKDNKDGYVSYLPSVMDFPMYDALRTALTEDEAWDRGLIRVYETLADDNLYADPMSLVIFAENHDTSRLYSLIDEDLERFNIAMTLLATMRGTPQFFYGSEVLATSPKTRDDGAVRSDFPGGWAGDTRNGFTGEGLTDTQRSAQAYLRQLLNWRQDQEAIHHGDLLHFAPHNGVYVFARYTGEQRILVAINHTGETRQLSNERYAQAIDGHRSGTDVLSGETLSLDNDLTLEPMSARILELH
ncbi:glycoside hydrolase family 13 protein [Marinimicrobium sp. C6131]|uniref:glycoside hydrolase family 13 protein n=1 Tax=Marinimicrobium sp. C6131 TaxID=3022676 RepID=UPI00223CB04E|nr:glycoside hydrolase family 13 protein [Marinimicrobium sp. C6131]UZJ43467.1 glycoside hydrolase family 13 protein [Marinimicrobium sp. C6131]